MAETPGTPSGSQPPDEAPRPVEGGSGSEPPRVEPVPAESSPALARPVTPPSEPPPAAEPSPPGPSTPEPTASEPPAPEPAGIASTLRVPPVSGGEAGPSPSEEEGGEWHLLVDKVRQWIDNAQLKKQWDRFRGPLRALLLLIGLILVLRLYGSVVNTIDAIPLISGLLELVGLITVLGFSATRLLRAEDRSRVLDDWSRAWQQFRGRL